MKSFLLIAIITSFSLLTLAENRFPKPDFTSGYQYPIHHYDVPLEGMWIYLDIFILVLLMSLVAWATVKRAVRWPIIVTSVFSVTYFGFFRHGCVCSIGSIQNIALALFDSSVVVSLPIILFFTLPILFTILFGRVFCSGVCPFGALQELVHLKNIRLSKALSVLLSIVPWIYLAFAVLFSITHSGFIICRYDPFIGIFRLGGEMPIIFLGLVLLVISMFVGRPFCRFVCPYGAILSIFSRVSLYKIEITKLGCINCELCHNACLVDAIEYPYINNVKENRMKGVYRILSYLILIPMLMVIGALIMRIGSDSFSRYNKTVRLYEVVSNKDIERPNNQTLEEDAFYGHGGTKEMLAQEVEFIKDQFKLYSTYLGAFLGGVFGLSLIGLSLKRTRKSYTINEANCVNCARCFSYCPQNKLEQDNEME